MSDTEFNHKEIWLEPWCEDCDCGMDRGWSHQNNWEDGCSICDRPAVKYVLAEDQD